VEEVAGRGTGLDDAGVLRKVGLLTRALKTNAELIEQGPMETLQVLSLLALLAQKYKTLT
jgi:NaMN:DMB phosphoribosyltransferase